MSYQGDKMKLTGRIELVSEDISHPTMATPQLFNDFLRKIANTEQAILDEFSSTAQQTNTLKHGLQVLTTDRATPVNVLNIKGRTLVNLLGNDGNCEDISAWTKTSVSIMLSLDTANKLYGTSGIKYVITDYGSKSTGGFYSRDLLERVNKTKYHLAMVDTKTGTADRTFIKASFRVDGSVYKDGNHILDQYNFQPTYVKIAPTDLVTADALRVWGIVTADDNETAYFDGFRIFEIDKSIYDKIDIDPEYTGKKLAEKFPYVDSVQHLQNPVIKKHGKNLLPPFTEWTMNANAKVVEPYKLQLDATTNFQGAYVDIPALPDTIYTFSDNFTGYVSSTVRPYHSLWFFDKNGTRLLQYDSQPTGTSEIITITSPANSVYIRVHCTNYGVGTFTFTNPQLELGSIARPFEPQNDEYLYLQTKLASNVAGTVYDSLFERSGQLFQMHRFKKDMALDGNLPWQVSADGTGYKEIRLNNFFLGRDIGERAVKYDGKVLMTQDIGIFPSADCINLGIEAGNTNAALWLSISDTESGWGETYTSVTQQEIQALMNGWKAKTVDGNGKPTAWKSILDNADAPTQTLAYVSANKAPNWKGWATLTYQLAESVEEPIIAEGSLSFHEGQNLVELAEGVIVRERANPIVRNELDYAQINTGSSSGSVSNNLKNRTNKILFIYKNGKVDNQWTLYSNYLGSSTANGGANATIQYAHYDPTAVYEVTYVNLDKHLFTGTALEASIQYATSDKSVLNEVVQQVSDNKTRLSVVETTYARKQQGQWIAPVLLNGWVNYGVGYSSAGYFKDDFGIVHLSGMIKGGTVGGTVPAFKLPAGYRPNVSHYFSASSYNGSIVFSSIEVGSNGYIVVSTGGNSWLSLDGITFRAEQ